MQTRTLLASAIAFALSTSVFAAKVPEGTQLADVQEITINNGMEPQSLDPHKTEGVPESQVVYQLMEGLITKDSDGRLQPGVAERWESTPDFKTWTFHLRKDAKWSNGDLITAKDFEFAWRRLADPKTASPNASYLNLLKVENAQDIIAGNKKPEELGVKAVDDNTFEVHLSEPVPYAPDLTVFRALMPLNQKVVEKYGDAWTKVENFVGNGAYKLAAHVVNEKLVFERNPQYWNDKETVINKATFLTLENATTDVARYRANDLQITNYNLPPEQFAKLKKEIPNEVFTPLILATFHYEFNHARAPFNDIRVRKALNLLLDRNIIVDKVLAQGQRATYVFTPTYVQDGQQIQQPEYSKEDQAKRNEEAVALLTELGYTKQKPLTFTLLYNTNENHKKVAIATASLFKQNSGGLVDMKLKNMEWKAYLSTRREKNFDVVRTGWFGDYNQASTFTNNFLSGSTNNVSSYSSKDYDNAIAESYQGDVEKRRAAYAKAEKILAQDWAIMPVYNYVNARLVKPYVKGYEGKDPQDNILLRNLYIIKH